MHLQKHFYDVIICDRYIWDTYIDFKLKYPQHSFEEWFIWKMLLKLYAKPDISILLHIPPEISMNRSKLKNDPFPEKIDERRNRLNMYMKAEQERLWQYKIDATSSVEDVSYQISSIIESFVYK
jgi:dTMP kinase